MASRERAAPSLPERVVEVLVAGFAAWTLVAQVCVLVGASFATLALVWPAAVLLAFGFLRAMRRVDHAREEARPLDEPVRRASAGPAVRLAGAAAIVLLYALSGSYLIFWIGSVALLVFFVLDGPAESAASIEEAPTDPRRELLVIGALAALSVVVTLVAHRTDPDDSFYLSVAVSALDHPERPLLAQDEMFGDPGLPLLAPVYRVQTYELLVGLAARLSGLPVKAIYYLLFPAISAVLVVLASWLALRELAGRRALLGTGVVLVVLLVWGDRHAGHGGFGLVRLFQGKALLVSVFVPVILYATARFLRCRDLASWLLLLLAQVGAVGVSANGILVGPATAAPLLLGSLADRRGDVRSVALGMLSFVYVALVGLALAFDVEAVHEMLPTKRAALGTEANLIRVIGDGFRAEIALFALLAVPALAFGRDRARRIAGWCLAMTVIWLNPLSSDLLARVARAMDWRIFWAIPFPILIGLMIDGVWRLGARRGLLAPGPALAAILGLAFVLAPAPWTLSPRNGTLLGAPGYKVDAAYPVAEAAVASTPADGLILAPWDVASWIPTLHGHPRVVEVRPHYLEIIARQRGMREAYLRRLLERSVDPTRTRDRFTRPTRPIEKRLPQIMAELQRRRVSTLVLAKDLPWAESYAALLREAGFVPRDFGRFAIWTRSDQKTATEAREAARVLRARGRTCRA